MRTHTRARALALAFAVAALSGFRPLAAQDAPSDTARPTAADSVEVVQVLERMFEALRTKNADGMRATLHDSARFTLLRPGQGGGTRVAVLSAAQFIRSATSPQGPAIDEPIRNLRMQMDGDLATVWAEYQVRIDGQVSHCGHDAFHLVRTADGWRILNVSDTFRQQGCGEAWPVTRP